MRNININDAVRYILQVILKYFGLYCSTFLSIPVFGKLFR